MIKAYKFYYFLHDGMMSNSHFLTEEEGEEFINNYECELLKIETVYITTEFAGLLA